jgi:phage terminase large subunit-like protein
MPAITYIDKPEEIEHYLVPGRKNLVFVWQHFDWTNITGSEIAKKIKSLVYENEIVLITSIDLSSKDRENTDWYISTSRKMDENDGAYMMVNYIKNQLPEPNENKR